MNDYQALLKMRTDLQEAKRARRNHQFAQDVMMIEKAQSFWLRFHFHLPKFSGFRLIQVRRTPRSPLNAH